MDRRTFLSIAAWVAAGSCSYSRLGLASGWPGESSNQEGGGSSGSSGAGWPSAGDGSQSRQTRGDRATFSLDQGCTLNRADSRALQSNFELLERTGWPYIDQAFSLETRVLGDVMGYRPGFAFFDDSDGPNAFATSDPFLGSSHGSVCFGVNLLKQEQEEQSLAWEGAAVFIMAHEWAHIAEFNANAVGTTVKMELLADFVAGWYLGFKTAHGSRFDARGAARSVFDKGDYAFNSRGHHGTPAQRLQAATAGWELALRGATRFSQAFSYGRRNFGL